VSGLATILDEQFVMRYGAQEIKVYDTATFTSQRNLSVSGLKFRDDWSDGDDSYEARRWVACSVNNCLYVSDVNYNKIHKTDAAGLEAVKSWSVGRRPYGLSINANHNVLVACYGENAIHEYTTQGNLVRKISLQSDITNPTSVVQLSSGQYGVTHHGKQHRFCIIFTNGQLVKDCGGQKGSGEGQLNSPFGLAVNKRGFVFIL